MFFLLVITLTAYSAITLPKTMAEEAARGAWIPIVVMAVIFAFIVLIITSLNNMFRGKTLADYSQKIVGKFFGSVISVYFLVYFFIIGVWLNGENANVLKTEFFHETPTWATILLGTPFFGAIAYKGATSTARLVSIYGLIYIITAVYVHITMLTQGYSYNLLPLYQKSDVQNYVGAVKDAVLPFLGIEVLTVFAFNEKNGKKAKWTAFLAILFIGAFYVLLIESTIMMVGIENAQYYNHVLIEAIKIVENPLLERFDILYLTIGFSALISGISVVYLAATEYACKLFSKANRLTVVIMIGVLMAALSILAMSMDEFHKVFSQAIPYAGLFTVVVIPLTLLIIAKVKNRAKKTR